MHVVLFDVYGAAKWMENSGKEDPAESVCWGTVGLPRETQALLTSAWGGDGGGGGGGGAGRGGGSG